MISSIYYNFLGAAPNWYKNTIISFLIVNPIIYILFDAQWFTVESMPTNIPPANISISGKLIENFINKS